MAPDPVGLDIYVDYLSSVIMLFDVLRLQLATSNEHIDSDVRGSADEIP